MASSCIYYWLEVYVHIIIISVVSSMIIHSYLLVQFSTLFPNVSACSPVHWTVGPKAVQISCKFVEV